MKTNVRPVAATITTHEGAPAAKESAQKELVRAVSACLLWEDTFYEKGNELAERIAALSQNVPLPFLCALARKARTDLKLRHAPLFLCVQALAKKADAAERTQLGSTIADVIQRADELAEIIALYWKDKKKPLPRQLKVGIARAFPKFDEYQLAKYDRAGKVRLRDALFLSHAKPKDEEQAALWKRLVENKLATPQTWEVALSGGADKKEAFTGLLTEKKLGYMALLRNLRNMVDAEVDRSLIAGALKAGAAKSRALPFRFIAAAKAAPKLEEPLGEALVIAASTLPKLTGRTLLVLDVSGSMNNRLSGKSEMSRVEAANGLAMLIREQADDVTVYATAGNDHSRIHATELVPSRRSFALADAVTTAMHRLGGGGIFMVQVMDFVQGKEKQLFDRTIIITDEQDCDLSRKASEAPKLSPQNYIINVGTYEPALPITGAGWTRISGFSERVLDWMMAEEQN